MNSPKASKSARQAKLREAFSEYGAVIEGKCLDFRIFLSTFRFM